MQLNRRKQQAKILRITRKLHRWLGISIFIFFIIVSFTGILLGWKKNTGGLLLAQTAEGRSSDFKTWMSIDTLYLSACKYLHDSVSQDLSTELDRIDIRKDKGMLKFIFKEHYWAVQLDGSTSELLQIERRRADLIEKIHDGSIGDVVFKTEAELIKVSYTSILGICLITISISGFCLWYIPRKMRRRKINPTKIKLTIQ